MKLVSNQQIKGKFDFYNFFTRQSLDKSSKKLGESFSPQREIKTFSLNGENQPIAIFFLPFREWPFYTLSR